MALGAQLARPSTTAPQRHDRRPQRLWRHRLLRTPFAVLGAGALVLGVPAVASAAPPTALPEAIDGRDGRFQPATTYDRDGCYPTPAIGRAGKLATGLKTTGALNGSCRDLSDLNNTNSYVRAKRNNGWEAFMYAYYFEKDQAAAAGGVCSACGHRHDWEHVVVWVKDNQVRYVSASAHGGYNTRPVSNVELINGTHPKIVYHKDGGSTHAFRFADANQPLQNHKGTWQYPDLVSWNRFPAGLRDKLTNHNFGKATLGIKAQGSRFAKELSRAKPAGIPFDPYGS